MTANPNLFFENSDDFIQHKINQARQQAEQDLIVVQNARREREDKARDIIASAYENAAEIALAGIENGLDSATCYGISTALKLQAMIVRGDVSDR